CLSTSRTIRGYFPASSVQAMPAQLGLYRLPMRCNSCATPCPIGTCRERPRESIHSASTSVPLLSNHAEKHDAYPATLTLCNTNPPVEKVCRCIIVYAFGCR